MELQQASEPARYNLKRPIVEGRMPGIRDEDELDRLSTAQIHDSIRWYLPRSRVYRNIAELVQYLIRYRGEQPSRFHYDALIRANADEMNGSAEVVGILLKEMKELGIAGDAELYHGALMVRTSRCH